MPKFTKQHYEAVAETIRNIRHRPSIQMQGDVTAQFVIDVVTNAFDEMFAADNANYNSLKFYEAATRRVEK